MSDAGRTCGSCRFFDGALCRFASPHAAYGWPKVLGDDWCGEWAAPRTAKQAGEADAIKPQIAEERRAPRVYGVRHQASLGGLR